MIMEMLFRNIIFILVKKIFENVPTAKPITFGTRTRPKNVSWNIDSHVYRKKVGVSIS